MLPSTKLFRHGGEQSCSAMTTQKLEEKVQQHDEVESGKSGWRRQRRALGNAYQQVPALICDTLQHTATHCNTLQHTATHCNTLQQMEGTWQCIPASAFTHLRHLCPLHLVRSYYLGGCFAHIEHNNPLKYLGNKSEIPHLNFTTPPIILAFNSK